MVTQESATSIDGQSGSRKSLPLDVDHSSLVKFKSGSDPNYTNMVLHIITDMVKAAPAVVEERFTGATRM